jgi:hypothetical protein
MKLLNISLSAAAFAFALGVAGISMTSSAALACGGGSCGGGGDTTTNVGVGVDVGVDVDSDTSSNSDSSSNSGGNTLRGGNQTMVMKGAAVAPSVNVGNCDAGFSFGNAAVAFGVVGKSPYCKGKDAALVAAEMVRAGIWSPGKAEAYVDAAFRQMGYKATMPAAETVKSTASTKVAAKAAPVPAGMAEMKVPDCETGAMRWLRSSAAINAYNAGGTVKFPNGKTASLSCS